MKIKTGELSKQNILSKNISNVLQVAKEQIMQNINEPGVKKNATRRITLNIEFIPDPRKDEIHIAGSVSVKLAPRILSFVVDEENLDDFLKNKGVKIKK